jgi:hypothetical protein
MNEHRDDYVVDFQVISFGLVYAFVCTSLPFQETTERLNAAHPTGLAYSPWRPATDERFVTGQSNPCECELCPETHRHQLFTC